MAITGFVGTLISEAHYPPEGGTANKEHSWIPEKENPTGTRRLRPDRLRVEAGRILKIFTDHKILPVRRPGGALTSLPGGLWLPANTSIRQKAGDRAPHSILRLPEFDSRLFPPLWLGVIS